MLGMHCNSLSDQISFGMFIFFAYFLINLYIIYFYILIRVFRFLIFDSTTYNYQLKLISSAFQTSFTYLCQHPEFLLQLYVAKFFYLIDFVAIMFSLVYVIILSGLVQLLLQHQGIKKFCAAKQYVVYTYILQIAYCTPYYDYAQIEYNGLFLN